MRDVRARSGQVTTDAQYIRAFDPELEIYRRLYAATPAKWGDVLGRYRIFQDLRKREDETEAGHRTRQACWLCGRRRWEGEQRTQQSPHRADLSTTRTPELGEFWGLGTWFAEPEHVAGCELVRRPMYRESRYMADKRRRELTLRTERCKEQMVVAADQAVIKVTQMSQLIDTEQLDTADSILLHALWICVQPKKLHANWGSVAFDAFDASKELAEEPAAIASRWLTESDRRSSPIVPPSKALRY